MTRISHEGAGHHGSLTCCWPRVEGLWWGATNDGCAQMLRMLLPPGKTPAQAKVERDETLRRLTDQARQIKELFDEKQAHQAKEQVRGEHRRSLLSELDTLPWYARKRRKEILAQLRRLEVDGRKVIHTQHDLRAKNSIIAGNSEDTEDL